MLTEAYCLLTGGRCSHYPITAKLNSFFISEPYDVERRQREQAILKAIKGHPYLIADHKIMNIALTCKICQQIQLAMFGIVDITGLNANVLTELGMLYGFNKPVVILVKQSEKTKIKIPSNIIGIEQVRYRKFAKLTDKLRKSLTTLFTLRTKMDEYLVNLKPILDSEIRQLEVAQSTRVLGGIFKGSIIDFKIIDYIGFAIINKGRKHGIKENMFFRVYRADRKVKRAYLEEDVGLIVVTHSQSKISLCQPFSFDPNNQFWQNAYSARLPRNMVKPYIPEPYCEMTDQEIEDATNKLKILQSYISLSRG